MSKVYTQGILSPKGFDMVSAEPVDQRTIVEFKADLYSLLKVYPGIKVQVLEDISGTILREFKFVGGDSSLEANWVEVVGGAGVVDPTTLPLQFTSFVFKRQVGAPDTPVGGDYDNPVPALWEGSIPAGTDPLWFSSAVFIQNDVTPIVWGVPALMEDTATTDFEYCTLTDVPVGEVVNGFPLPPLENVAQRDYWHNTPTLTDDFMAMGTKVAGEYPTNWEVAKISGEEGVAGPAGSTGSEYTQSIVFTRTNTVNMEIAVVTGGGFGSPYPTSTTISGAVVPIVWTDGIPDGDEKVWLTKFVFNSVGHATPSPSNTWTTPSNITDTNTTDFEFSGSIAEPQDPDTAPGEWHAVALSSDIWMAVRTISNGVIGAWGITKIKGETGEAGQGMSISGRDTITNILAKTTPEITLYDIWVATNDEPGATVPGVINDAYLYVGVGLGDNGTEWSNIGAITGTDGVSYKQSTVFLRSTSVPTTPSGGTFDTPVPAGWTDGIPAVAIPLEPTWASTRFFANDSIVNAALPDWGAPYLATDSIDEEFVYADEQPGDATPLPPDQAAFGVWYDEGVITSVWMAKASRVNGTTDPATWTILRIKGEAGATGATGTPSLLASAYFKSNADISAENVTGGTYASPIPTSTITGISWSDGIPAGDGAIWFTQVRFEQTDTGTKVWPAPTLVVDSSIVEYQFSSSVSQPIGDPIEGNQGGNTWYDAAQDIVDLGGTPRWMAIGSIKNGVWPITWDMVQIIGETGATGSAARTYIPSTRFARSDASGMDQINVIGQYLIESNGVFGITGNSPVQEAPGAGGYQYIFTDGIPPMSGTFPNNARRIWMIQHVFNSVDDLGVGNIVNWGPAQLMQDSSGTDYQYHRGDGSPAPGKAGTKPAEPTGVGSEPDSAGWYSTPESPGLETLGGAYWIAQKNWAEGPGAVWVVYQIRGEGDAPDVGLPPAQVTGVYGDTFGYGTITIHWDNGNDPDNDLVSYEINDLNSGSIVSSVGTSITYGYLPADTTIGFRVRGVDSFSNKGPWSTTYLSPILDNYVEAIQGDVASDPDCIALTTTYYVKKYSVHPGVSVGDYIYTNPAATIPQGFTFTLQLKNNTTQDPNEPNYRLSVDSNGKVTAVGTCSSI